MLVRWLDRLSRPTPRKRLQPKRRERLRVITITLNTVLTLLLLGSVVGVVTLCILVWAPQLLSDGERRWRAAYWRTTLEQIDRFNKALDAGDEQAAVGEAGKLFGTAQSGIRLFDYPYEQLLQTFTRGMQSPWPTLRRIAAEASIAHHDYDSLAWYTLGVAKLDAGDREGAETALRRALAMRPFWPQASARLVALLAASGKSVEAAAITAATQRASAALVSSGLPVHVVVLAGNDANGTLVRLDNCRARVVQVPLPKGAHRGYAVLPEADGLAIDMRIAGRFADARLPPQRWRVTATAQVETLSTDRFLTRIAADTPLGAAPAITFQSDEALVGDMVELELKACVGTALAAALDMVPMMELEWTNAKGMAARRQVELSECRTVNVADRLPAGVVQASVRLNRSTGYLRLDGGVRSKSREAGHRAGQGLQLMPSGDYALESFASNPDVERRPTLTLYKGSPLRADTPLNLAATWCGVEPSLQDVGR